MIYTARFFPLLLLPFFLFACTSKPSGGHAGETFTPVAGGVKTGGVFRTNNVSDISSLDPVRLVKQSEILIGQQVFDLVINLNDSTLALEPMLAKRWEISPDALVYTFHLRGDVFFHDDACFSGGKGKKLTASDVKYSLTRVLDARTQSLGAEFFTSCVLGAREYYDATIAALKSKSELGVKEVTGFVAENDTTFVVRLSQPYAPFLYHLTAGFGSVTCQEAVEKYGTELSRHPVGTGAFSFVKWDENREVFLKRNPNYWQTDASGNRLPYLEGVSYGFLKEAASQLLEFQKGTFDESIGIPQEFSTRIFGSGSGAERTGATPGEVQGEFKAFTLKSSPELRIDYIAMQTTDSLFKNKKLRQAISSAIDRDKIVKFVLKNQVIAATGVVAKGFAGYDNSGLQVYSYNLEKAKALLAEAGYAGGKGLPEIVLHTFTGAKYAYNKEVAEAVQSMLAELGLKVSISQTEYSTHLQQAYLGKLGLFIASWGADYPEPESFLNLLYGNVVPKDAGAESYLNLSRYQNAAFDSVFGAALKISDEAKRYALYQKAEQIAMADCPIILSYYRLSYRFQQPFVRNYPINAMDRRDYRRVWLDK